MRDNIMIDSNIPIPKASSGKKGIFKYPFEKMKIGDSFFVPEGARTNIFNVQQNATLWAERNKKNWKFTMRVVEGGARLWRVPINFYKDEPEYKIESNVPVPPRVIGGTRHKLKQKLLMLKVKQSIHVPDYTYSNLYNWVLRISIKPEFVDKQYVVQSAKDGGARVWRVK